MGLVVVAGFVAGAVQPLRSVESNAKVAHDQIPGYQAAPVMPLHDVVRAAGSGDVYGAASAPRLAGAYQVASLTDAVLQFATADPVMRQAQAHPADPLTQRAQTHPDDSAPNDPPPTAAAPEVPVQKVPVPDEAAPAESWYAALLTRLDALVERMERGDVQVQELLFRVARLEDAAAGAGPAVSALPEGRQQAAAEGSGTTAGYDPDAEPVVDDEMINRALERSLIQEGGLLLPTWGFEVTPQFSYSFDGSNGLRIVDLNGLQVVAPQDVRRDILEASATFRIGLPWESQAELTVPYIIDEEETVTAGAIRDERSGSGLGDIRLGLSKQVLHEDGWVPSLLATGRWKTPSGDSNVELDDDDVALGSGFHGLEGSVTAVKSHDPLVFFANFSYTANLPDEKNGTDINPGDAIGFGLGTILAASPDASLRFAFDQSFIMESRVNGDRVPGSDVVQSSLEVGGSMVLSKSVLLDLALEIGLTNDAPDYQIRTALPIRF